MAAWGVGCTLSLYAVRRISHTPTVILPILLTLLKVRTLPKTDGIVLDESGSTTAYGNMCSSIGNGQLNLQRWGRLVKIDGGRDDYSYGGTDGEMCRLSGRTV